MKSTFIYKDLDVWKSGHQLVILVYRTTKNFPSSEQFGLTNQMRRAAVSVTSNIAEGFARRNKGEKTQFYYTSLGSLTELTNQVEIARDISYLDLKTYNDLILIANTAEKLLRSLIRSTQNKS